MRFVAHDSRAENSIRFVGIALDWMMAVQMARKAAHQCNVLWDADLSLVITFAADGDPK